MFNKEDNLFMLDIETDGLSPSVNHITSICVQKFTMHGGLIGAPIHVAMDKAFGGVSRYADRKALQWREENGVDNEESKLPVISFAEFYEILNLTILEHGKKDCHFIANHPEFDFGFLQNYADQANYERCWHYQNVWDLGSLIRGLRLNRGVAQADLKGSANWQKVLDTHFGGEQQPHNAHYDCVYQIETLRWANDLSMYIY